ncbi:hypothetical protein ACE1OA_05305 [Streptomyces sp. JL2001]|uniref:hypothetical protein n=1 Tax=Streptomyces sp. JL2001 TaxID=3342488 RepID=UPI003D808DB1
MPSVVRLIVLVAVGVGLAFSGSWAADAYREAQVYRGAALCGQGAPAGAEGQRGCVAVARGTVLDRARREDCSWDSNGDGTSSYRCTTSYEVRIRRPARTEWHDVGYRLYEDARPGDRAEVRTWQGGVVRVVVRGHTETYLTGSEFLVGLWCAVCWLLLGLGLWAAFGSGFGTLFAFHNAGWIGLAFPVGVLGYGLLLGMSVAAWIGALVGAAFLVWWTVGARNL